MLTKLSYLIPGSKISSFVLLLGITWLMPGVAMAEVYKWIDENGKIHFSDQKPDGLKSETLDIQVNTFTSVSYDLSIFDTGGKVIMYSTSWCGYCKKAKRYFKKNNIPFTEYDIETNSKARRQYKKMGATGVPVILVGKKRMNGFSAAGFARLYR